MTPSAHATAAADLLAIVPPGGDHVTADKNARLAIVHAVLATKAGTGTNYSLAEQALDVAALATGTRGHITRAHAFALLAA